MVEEARVCESSTPPGSLSKHLPPLNANFLGNATVLVEKYITCPRHAEVQVFADEHVDAIGLRE